MAFLVACEYAASDPDGTAILIKPRTWNQLSEEEVIQFGQTLIDGGYAPQANAAFSIKVINLIEEGSKIAYSTP